MARIEEQQLGPARYDLGGDEFVFVELDREMSFAANFKGLAITERLATRELPGIVDICPANASYLIRFDPDELAPGDLVAELRAVERELGDATEHHFATRVVDVPVLYEDPWTHEALMRFRDRHQDPEGTDLEYSARVNGYATKDEFIAAHHGSPYFVSMVGFVPGLPWCFQMVPRERQIEVPKYVRPRTYTPERAVGHGGAFAVIYPVTGAGGYQLYGIAPAPIFDLSQSLGDFADSIVFPRAADIFKYRPIDRDEFDRVRGEVEAGTFRYRVRDVDFEPAVFFEDPDRYNADLVERLYAD